jgi:thiamine pyrophosphokinase
LVTGFEGPVIAADGGAGSALDLGLLIDSVIGDLDSLDQPTRDRLGRTPIIHDRDQDTTDFEKCLARIDAPLVIGAGFVGGRLDHTLAVLSALVSRTDTDVVLLGPSDVIFPTRRGLRLDLPPGTRVSLYPMGPVRGRSTGLEWPIVGLDLSPSGRVATSNRATGPVTVEAEGPLLAILPLGCLRQAVDALRRARSG